MPVLAVVSAHLNIFLSVRKSNVLSNICTEPSNFLKIRLIKGFWAEDYKASARVHFRITQLQKDRQVSL